EDAPAVRADDHVGLAWMNEDVVGAHGGIIVHELLPVLAAVERCVEAELGADEEEILVLRILLHDLNVAVGRQIVRDALERAAVIARDEEVRVQIVAAVAVY